jgi:lysyl-tRNA synthetase class 2
LAARAELLATVRAFFRDRGVMEVQTGVLGAATVTEPAVESIAVPGVGYLQTSPEYQMKRLLAAGAPSIYQLGPVFRAGEAGRRHNPEFTMLEWYRPGFGTRELIDEVAELVVTFTGRRASRRDSWRELFLRHARLDPFAARDADLRQRAAALAGEAVRDWAREELLDLLFSELVEPRLGQDCLQFVEAFPAARASLARTSRDAAGNAVADRFELFVDGCELANGYDELCDAAELRRRMEADNARRAARGLPAIPPDERLLAAMAHGLPGCAGVALGVDRLLMIALGAKRIDEVMAFAAERA